MELMDFGYLKVCHQLASLDCDSDCLDISYPLHVIPLMIESAFVIVTENSTFVAKASDILSGNATFRQVAMQSTSGIYNS